MEIRSKRLYRSADFDGKIDKEKRTVELSFSSEEPYERFFGVEILGHKAEEVRLDRLNSGGALLADHDTKQQIGKVEKAWLDSGGIGRAVVRFGKGQKASEYYEDVIDGIRSKVSVGYEVREMEKISEDETTELKTYRVTDWTPLEISFVSIPADNSVGVGRSDDKEFVIKIKNNEVVKMAEEIKATEAAPAPAIDISAEREKAQKFERNRINDINIIAAKYHQEEMAKSYIESGKSPQEFGIAVLEKVGEVKSIQPKDSHIGMSEKEIKRFSLLNAVRAQVEGNWNVAPFEKECVDAQAKKFGKSPKGFFLPEDVVHHRDLTVGTPTSAGTGGGNLVETGLIASSFIDMLRNRMVTKQMGIRILDGLQGDVLIPKQTGGGTAYWISENSAITAEGNQTFTQVSMRPKTVGAYTDISRKLIIQSSLGIENLVRQDLATVLALEIDRCIIEGTNHGNTGEPTGILMTSGIGSVDANGAAVSYANILELWSDVATQNADMGSLGFLTSPALCAQLMRTFTNSTYGEMPVWSGGPGDGRMIGMKAMVTNQMPTDMSSDNNSCIIFGNWADCILGTWSGIDVLTDPYTGGTAGTVRIILMHDCDIAIRHAESFAAIIDALTPTT